MAALLAAVPRTALITVIADTSYAGALAHVPRHALPAAARLTLVTHSAQPGRTRPDS